MLTAIVLDTNPLSLAAQEESKPSAIVIRKWIKDWTLRGAAFYIPEVTDYEVRRELIRAGKIASINRLDELVALAEYLPITTGAMRHAAHLWAHVRNLNLTTADKQALDCDVILCAQALNLGIPAEQIIVATSNAAHIGRFLNAAAWADIQPDAK